MDSYEAIKSVPIIQEATSYGNPDTIEKNYDPKRGNMDGQANIIYPCKP